jgi:hypothetical protein
MSLLHPDLYTIIKNTFSRVLIIKSTKFVEEFDFLKSNKNFFCNIWDSDNSIHYIEKSQLLQNGGHSGSHAASIGPTTLHRQAGQAVLQQRAQGGPARLSQLINTCRALCRQSQAKLPEIEVVEGEASELRAARVEDVGNAEKLATEVHLSLQVCRWRGGIVRAPVELAQIPLSDQDLGHKASMASMLNPILSIKGR